MQVRQTVPVGRYLGIEAAAVVVHRHPQLFVHVVLDIDVDPGRTPVAVRVRDALTHHGENRIGHRGWRLGIDTPDEA